MIETTIDNFVEKLCTEIKSIHEKNIRANKDIKISYRQDNGKTILEVANAGVTKVTYTVYCNNSSEVKVEIKLSDSEILFNIRKAVWQAEHYLIKQNWQAMMPQSDNKPKKRVLDFLRNWYNSLYRVYNPCKLIHSSGSATILQREVTYSFLK